MEHHEFTFESFESMRNFINTYGNLKFLKASREVDILTGKEGKFHLRCSTNELFPVKKDEKFDNNEMLFY